jgi:hypothetical protein
MSGYYPVIILPPRHSDAKITYRNGARQGVNVEIDMKASGHTSVQMHKRYLDLQREDIAKPFGLLQDGKLEPLARS